LSCLTVYSLHKQGLNLLRISRVLRSFAFLILHWKGSSIMHSWLAQAKGNLIFRYTWLVRPWFWIIKNYSKKFSTRCNNSSESST
jgi:hypothetical protein